MSASGHEVVLEKHNSRSKVSRKIFRCVEKTAQECSCCSSFVATVLLHGFWMEIMVEEAADGTPFVSVSHERKGPECQVDTTKISQAR